MIKSDIFKNLPTDIIYNRIFIFLENYTRIELKCYNPVWLFQSERGCQRLLNLSLELMYKCPCKMHREEFMKRWTTGLLGIFNKDDTVRKTYRKSVYDDGRIEYQITTNSKYRAISASEPPSFWAK